MDGGPFCYVVMAHQGPDDVLALVDRIRELSPDASVLVRTDGGLLVARETLGAHGAKLLDSTIRLRWGGWSQVLAVLECLEAALSTGAGAVVIVSGQDHPVRDLRAWEESVRGRGVDVLLAPMEGAGRQIDYRWRVVRLPVPPGSFAMRALRHLGWRANRVTMPRVQVAPSFRAGDRRWWLGTRRASSDRPPDGLPVVHAATWLTLSARAAREVLAYHRAHPETAAWFRTVRTPDEVYLPSLLSALPGVTLAHAVTSAVRFAPRASNPMWLDRPLLRELACGGQAPFVRKVAPGDPHGVRAAADALVAEERRRRSPGPS